MMKTTIPKMKTNLTVMIVTIVMKILMMQVNNLKLENEEE